MKRVVRFAIPILATFFAIGLGLYFLRTQPSTAGRTVAAVRKAVAGAIDEVAHEVEEVIE